MQLTCPKPECASLNGPGIKTKSGHTAAWREYKRLNSRNSIGFIQMLCKYKPSSFGITLPLVLTSNSVVRLKGAGHHPNMARISNYADLI
jgi:hypothetical protein